ncbi:hypothetical protein XFHB_12925 (plasmid) [Xylella fastidiosa]|uniref:DNA helicase n=1 Tax=Xylella fastidiosa TaxID=2371 RepID=A0ABD7BY51_XYLFS|nr:hypothetical protein [Xylella fastidiosa]QPB72727.1 hypothetical protein XFHB_12925 [Xylella fastidiosa]
MINKLEIAGSINDKPFATEALKNIIQTLPDLPGQLFIGYPYLIDAKDEYFVDAALVSPSKGIVLFDLIESTDINGYAERQDHLALMMESKLQLYKELMQGRELQVPVSVISFAPKIKNIEGFLAGKDYPLVNKDGLAAILNTINWPHGNDHLYRKALSSIEIFNDIKGSEMTSSDKIKNLYSFKDSITTLTNHQNKAILENLEEGMHLIAGLSGSGRTTTLALKAAYWHLRYPDSHIAITCNTLSDKNTILDLIKSYIIAIKGNFEENKIKVSDPISIISRYYGNEFRDNFSQEKLASECVKIINDPFIDLSSQEGIYDIIFADKIDNIPIICTEILYSTLKEPKRFVATCDEDFIEKYEELRFSCNSLKKLKLTHLSSFENNKEQLPMEHCHNNTVPAVHTDAKKIHKIQRRP